MNNRIDPPPIWQPCDSGDGILWLIMNDAKRSVNLLSIEALEALSTTLQELRIHPPKALVIRSGKPSGFIAGADVAAFANERHPIRLMAYIRLGHEVMDTLANLPFPTVAVIHGHALGGGLELALACRHRVVVDDPTTRLGLPEVQLGIHPGFGGSVRLPALIGHAAAMKLMLTGRTLSAREAVRLGLADLAVPPRHLETAILDLLSTAASRRTCSGFRSRLLVHWPLRPLAALAWHRATESKAPAHHYPAPHALIDLWHQHANNPQAMLEAEQKSVAALATTQTARHLTRLFFLRERMKGMGKGSLAGIHHLHVVGAGVMGGDIAAWVALKGIRVTLQDSHPTRLGPAFKRAAELFSRKAGGWRQAREAMDRLIPDLNGDGVAKADLVIEAISENLSAKQALLIELESRLKPEALLATNTSALSLQELALVLKRPERLFGLHFFNPVEKMGLIEVVSGPLTHEETTKRGCAFAVSLDRLPLLVQDSPGFLINRLLMPYLLEAVLMASEGFSVASVDAAARGFGMPMGPLLLADQVGLDIILSVCENLSVNLNCAAPTLLRERVNSGHLGKKSGQGFYHHPPGKPARPVQSGRQAPEDTVDRLILPMVNAAMTTLRQGVVTDADLLDAGMVFGAGFAPFRGGPLSYAKSLGKEEVTRRLREISIRSNGRLEVDSGWKTFDFATETIPVEKGHEQEYHKRTTYYFTTVGKNLIRLIPGTG
ncbi:MAG: enoyl-CoA hydratase/isomerase family protein [Magnetococcales bacterium]|nr:enoyl-CoA hydratase/isomerase family protein [Magnetococcales bacterium]MBF0439613.1 enoyl-CoA hydratase/isomerase family protein [Magnetococcales bacterium]